MTLSDYDPKLLEFLYELTKLKKVMSYREIADNITIQGKKVSSKTVERWFNFLRSPYNYPNTSLKNRFDYYPSFFYEKLGLKNHYLILDDPKINVLKDFSFAKYLNYAVWLYDLNLKKSVLATAYPIPIKQKNSFERKIENLKKGDYINDFDLISVNSSFMIYSPWHKVIDEKGGFHPENNHKPDLDTQVNNFLRYLKSLPDIKVSEGIRINPLIVPVLFEYHFKSYNSKKVWFEIKNKLGDKTWDYIVKKKNKTDGFGIKRIQRTINEIEELNILSQMKIVYLPLQLNSIFIFLDLSFKNIEDLAEKLKELSNFCIQMSIYPKDKTNLFLILSTNHNGLRLLCNTFEKIRVNKFLILQHEKSLSLLTDKKIYKFDYSLFNPKKFDWK